MALRRYTVETCHYCAKKSHKRRIFHRLAARCTPTQREKNEQRNSLALIWKSKEISYQIKHNQWGFKTGIDNPMLTFNGQCVTLCTNFANQANIFMCIRVQQFNNLVLQAVNGWKNIIYKKNVSVFWAILSAFAFAVCKSANMIKTIFFF